MEWATPEKGTQHKRGELEKNQRHRKRSDEFSAKKTTGFVKKIGKRELAGDW